MPPKKPIDAMQRKLIHIAKAQLRIPDSDYRALLVQFTPTSWDMPSDKPSCVHMTYEEAHNLLQHFKSMGFTIVSKQRGERRRGADNIVNLVSPQQLSMIDHLRKDIKWYTPDGYFRFLNKFLKKDRVTTGKEAFRVIEALKGMRKRQNLPPRPAATPPKIGGELGGV